MAKRSKSRADSERLKAFGERLRRLMIQKRLTGAELARKASVFAGVEMGRHLISAYVRGENEPSEEYLRHIAKVLGVRPEELLPPPLGEGEAPQYATATTTIDGKTRLVVDAEVEPEVALKILTMVRAALPKKVA